MPFAELHALSPPSAARYALGNIDPKVLSTPQELKEEISKQVGEAVPRFQEFPIGFIMVEKCGFKTKLTLMMLGSYWRKTLTLWCHGSRKKKRSAIDSDHDDASGNSDSEVVQDVKGRH